MKRMDLQTSGLWKRPSPRPTIQLCHEWKLHNNNNNNKFSPLTNWTLTSTVFLFVVQSLGLKLSGTYVKITTKNQERTTKRWLPIIAQSWNRKVLIKSHFNKKLAKILIYLINYNSIQQINVLYIAHYVTIEH